MTKKELKAFEMLQSENSFLQAQVSILQEIVIEYGALLSKSQGKKRGKGKR